MWLCQSNTGGQALALLRAEPSPCIYPSLRTWRQCQTHRVSWPAGATSESSYYCHFYLTASQLLTCAAHPGLLTRDLVFFPTRHSQGAHSLCSQIASSKATTLGTLSSKPVEPRADLTRGTQVWNTDPGNVKRPAVWSRPAAPVSISFWKYREPKIEVLEQSLILPAFKTAAGAAAT